MRSYRKVFLSFSGTICGLRKGNIFDRELADGLFYFGSARGYAFDRDVGYWGCDIYKEKVRERLLKFVILAELDGRCVWRPDKGKNTFAQLDALLKKNKYKGVLTSCLKEVFWDVKIAASRIDLMNNHELKVSPCSYCNFRFDLLRSEWLFSDSSGDPPC